MIAKSLYHAPMNREPKETSLDSLVLYMNEAGKYPLLTKEQEVELAQGMEVGREAWTRLQEGDLSEEKRLELDEAFLYGLDCREKFINSNLRLVVSVAKKRRIDLLKTMSLLDLIQEGNTGLERAVEKFNWRKGFKFSTYATFWIKQSIDRGLLSDHTIRVPQDLYPLLGRQDVTDQTGGDRLSQAAAATELMYLDSPINSSPDNAHTLGETIAADSNIEGWLDDFFDHELLEILFNKANLTEQERRAISLSYGIGGITPMTQKEIAEAAEIPRYVVLGLMKSALKKLSKTAEKLELTYN